MTWTDERPREEGEYWVALHPDQRDRLYASPPVICATVASLYRLYASPPVICATVASLSVRWFDSDRQECSLGLDDLMFDGAKWSRRETPADPFEEVKA